MRGLLNYFLKGLVFVAPIAITLWALIFTFREVDSWIGAPVPGVGLLLVIGIITAIGFLLSSFFADRINQWADEVFGKLPFIKVLYSALKDLMNAFVGEKKKFDRPVLVDLTPDGSVRAFGFMTRESLADFGLHDDCAVYLPQSYNFAGFLTVVPKSRVKPLPHDSAELMAFIVFGGIGQPSPSK